MTTTHMTCAECGKKITVKGSFWTNCETTAIGNAIIFPHYLKHHRDKLNAKKLFRVLVNNLFLLFFVPIHAVLFVVYYALYPLYWLLDQFYG